MDKITDAAPARGARGRWAPGQSGNAAGKQRGTRNRASRLRELLAEGDEALAVEVLMDRVRAGDGVAARFVLDRLFPKPRDRAIDLELPDDASPVELFERVLRLMAAGEITLDEASRAARLIEQRRMLVDVATPPAADTASPAFDLHSARDHTTTPATAGTAPPPLNRYTRRRAAALQRAAHPPPPSPAPTPPLTAAA